MTHRVAATTHAVLSKLRALRCTDVALDSGALPASFALQTEGGKLFFVPKPLLADGYTQDQLDEIEATLQSLDLEMLPLDNYLH